MGLYLDELWLAEASLQNMKAALRAMQAFVDAEQLDADVPRDLRLIAGPWFSNEEAKVIFVSEMKDPGSTFAAWTKSMATGVFVRRRLTSLGDLAMLRAALERLDVAAPSEERYDG